MQQARISNQLTDSLKKQIWGKYIIYSNQTPKQTMKNHIDSLITSSTFPTLPDSTKYHTKPITELNQLIIQI